MMRENVLALLLIISVFANGYLLLTVPSGLRFTHPWSELYSSRLSFRAAKLIIRGSLLLLMNSGI